MAANATKTIEWALPMMTTTVATATAGTYTDSADTTIYIPETTSRTFKSVMLEVCCHDNLSSVSYNVSGWGLRLSCDSGTTWTTATIASGYNQTGENISHIFVADMTAEFTARFSGTSDTCRYGIYMTYSSTSTTYTNVSAKLYITYDYDASAHSTRIKTVRIPIESNVARLSTTAAIVGQASTAAQQIPNLSTFLPESSVTVRQMFCELWTNSQPSAATAAAVVLKIDSDGGEVTFGTIAATAQTPIWYRILYDITAIGTSAAHDLYARHNAASGSFYSFLGGWLTVTYEYNHTNSTTILNSILFCLADESQNVQTSTDLSRYSIKRFIQEPGTITLKQSGVFFTAQTGTTSTTFTPYIGNQATTGYTPTSQTGQAGMFSIMQRVDSGANRGAGITLSRGENTFTIQWYVANANYVGGVSALMILNYTSGKHALGDNVHTQSRYYAFSGNNTAAATVKTVTPTPPAIISSYYYLIGITPVIYINGTSGTLMSLNLSFRIQSNEKFGAGWEDVFSVVPVGPGERMPILTYAAGRKAFKRWPNDPDTDRVDIETSRKWSITQTSGQLGLGLWVTWHEITYSISGTVSGYTGDGSGIVVSVRRSDTNESIGTATTVSSGGYSLTWYDNTINLIADARQDATHVGRSDNGTAS